MLLYNKEQILIWRTAMKNYIFAIILTLCIAITSIANAQLPSNPWEPKPPSPNDGYFGDNLPQSGPAVAPNAPQYQAGVTGGEILPVDPWARARDRSGIQTWRGSGQHGRLNYVGEATTYDTSYGQERIAPEVNRHNMFVMTEHLRKLGYNIPKSYDQNIRNAPQEYKKIVEQAYVDVFSNDDPISGITTGLMDGFEAGTGLEIKNLLFNSIDLISTD